MNVITPDFKRNDDDRFRDQVFVAILPGVIAKPWNRGGNPVLTPAELVAIAWEFAEAAAAQRKRGA